MGFHSYQCFLFLVLLAYAHLLFQPSRCCHDHERSALLQFKSSFIINCAVASDPATAYPKVKSWGRGGDPHHRDCCSWDGVHCDEETGHVIGLNLSSSCLYGTFPSHSTLFNLTNLQLLSLTDNHFNGSEIPEELGQFNKLVSLDLSDSGFTSQIPLAISNLSNLSLLDLSCYAGCTKAPSQLRLKDPSLAKLVQNLTHLNRLLLNAVDISSSLPDIFTSLTSLRLLSLRFCNLGGQFPTNIFHLPHLEVLDLSGNINLRGRLPKFQQNSPLSYLNLQLTSFFGELPSSIGEVANLEELTLIGCYFSGRIPSSLCNLRKLTSLNLNGWNAFSGELPSCVTNLTKLQSLGLSDLNGRPERLISWLSNLNQLTQLTLHRVNIGSDVPFVIGNLTNLVRLELVNNQLTGGIPHWFMNLTQLADLSLLDNLLKGPIISLGISQLANLETLLLGGNSDVHGSMDALLRLSKNMEQLDLSGVKLTSLFENAANESTPSLQILELNSCNLTEFPRFLQNLDGLLELHLKDNNIDGFIPLWFVNCTQKSLKILDLSNNLLTGFEKPLIELPWSNLEILWLQDNQLQGLLPIPPSSMLIYQLSNNQLAGGIPRQICEASSMYYFDISNNSLSGEIPKCIIELARSLLVLNLESNKFNGTMPDRYPKSCSLKMVNLGGNQLEGSMPRSLANCINLEVIDVGRNHIYDTFPSWLGGLPNLHILVLRYNKFHGKIGKPTTDLDFHDLHIIDLSNNLHSGHLPCAYLENWNAMKVTNESQTLKYGTNTTFQIVTTQVGFLMLDGPYEYSITITNKGNDRSYPSVLKAFRVVDFSCNNFTGRIPNFMGNLRGLQALNLSNNILQGIIPSSLTNMVNLESLDLSNNKLSGEIPQGLAQLTFLEVFNVSYNLLKGPIPQGKQFWTFDYSSFVGNSGLCGSPLSKKCGNAFEEPPPAATLENNNDKEEDSMLIDWIIRCLGTVSGFVVGCAFGKYLTDRNHEWLVETFGRRKKGTPRTRGRRVARRRN